MSSRQVISRQILLKGEYSQACLFHIEIYKYLPIHKVLFLKYFFKKSTFLYQICLQEKINQFILIIILTVSSNVNVSPNCSLRY